MPAPTPDAPVRTDRGRFVRTMLAVTAAVSLLVGLGSAFGVVAYVRAGDAGIEIPDLPTDAPARTEIEQAFGPCIENVCNYLLLGSDSRVGLSKEERDRFGTDQEIGGENRADTIMLVHTDPELEKAIILSFPRDLSVTIPGHGEDKINASFEGGIRGGGAQLVGATVHKLTGLKINHILYVDLAGFQGVVETLGGVEMCISGENVNTPGAVAAPGGGTVYYRQRGFIADPFTGLLVKPGCRTLPADQALAYVRTRHLRCDGAAPDFYRITRQQQFLRAVINRLLQPEQLAQLPFQIEPIMQNLTYDRDLSLADLAFLVGELQGISSGEAEFRTVPAYPDPSNMGILRMDRSAERIFEAVREGTQLGDAGRDTAYTPPSEATVPVIVVDHASGGSVQGVQDVLSQAGFDISPGLATYAGYGKKVAGSVIAHAPDAGAEAQVVAKYFPGLALKQVKGLPDDVAVFVDGSYRPQPVGGGGAPAGCPAPEA